MTVILEVVLGLSFLFATLALIGSGVNELISSALALRARTLRKGVAHLVANREDALAIYRHPVVQSLFRRRRGPSYIPPSKFTLALLDLKVPAALGRPGAAQAPAVAGAIGALGDGPVKNTLDVLWRDAGDDIARFRRSIEGWFDDTMERVSGWYRRLIQMILLLVGLGLAIGLNVNTITVTQRLWEDAPLRATVVDEAERATAPAEDGGGDQGVKESLDEIEDQLDTVRGLSLPIGWGDGNRPSWDAWYIAAAGWLLTAMAVSIGAPFWFDLLGRVARFRSTGVRLETSVPPSAETEPAGGRRTS